MIDRDLLKIMFPEKLQANQWASYIEDTPVPRKPVVSQLDVEDGFVYRYFVRQANDVRTIVEIDKIQYQKFKKNPRFKVVEVRWKIVGKKENDETTSGIVSRGVRDFNLQTVSKIDLKFGGLMKYIKDYTEFWVGETIDI